jgi:hypothetical protein
MPVTSKIDGIDWYNDVVSGSLWNVAAAVWAEIGLRALKGLDEAYLRGQARHVIEVFTGSSDSVWHEGKNKGPEWSLVTEFLLIGQRVNSGGAPWYAAAR